ncbi:hypothetical protein KIN20_026035 [Parelaphostrongylus tenuis]|uniref:Uncharacterized protein n=1 Tax=Parelaphostrongylus tenuis TaxID=148309 RepID=A0AAD5MW50_PARTN|nr:hypothetical protein KIN20_026035 [Parelaphostrongylus tenuis]
MREGIMGQSNICDMVPECAFLRSSSLNRLFELLKFMENHSTAFPSITLWLECSLHFTTTQLPIRHAIDSESHSTFRKNTTILDIQQPRKEIKNTSLEHGCRWERSTENTFLETRISD